MTLLLAAVLGVSAFLAQTAASSPQDTETITLSSLNTYKPGFEPLIAEFERLHPNIKVKPIYYVAGSPQEIQVPTRFAAGNGTDLIVVISASSSVDSVWPMSKSGLLADLSKQPWAKDTPAADLPLYSYGGKLRALDLGFSALAVLSYNKDYFKSKGFKKPTTFAQLLDLCKKIAADGKIPIAWGGENVYVNMNNVASLAGNTVFSKDKHWYAKRLNHKTTFAGTPGWRRALQQVLDMKDANCFSPGVEGVPLPEMLSQFATGQAAMMFTYGGLNALVLQQTPKLNIGMFSTPGDTAASTTLTTQPSGGLAMWSKTKHPEAALEFLKFIAQPKSSRAFTKLNYLISPPDARAGRPPGFYSELAPFFKSKKIVAAIVSQWPNQEIEPGGGAAIQGLFTGQKTVDQALADMDTLIDKR